MHRNVPASHTRPSLVFPWQWPLTAAGIGRGPFWPLFLPTEPFVDQGVRRRAMNLHVSSPRELVTNDVIFHADRFDGPWVTPCERSVTKQIYYFERFCPSTYVPRALLGPMLEEATRECTQTQGPPAYQGNLCSCVKWADRFWLAHPSGSLLQRVCVRPLEREDDEDDEFTVDLRMPLRQIDMAVCPQSVESPLLLTRTAYQSRIVRLGGYQDNGGSSHRVSFDLPIVDAALNPHWLGEAIYTTEDGALHLWDGRDGGCRVLSTVHGPPDSTWRRISYGAHPRVLRMMDVATLSYCDIRAMCRTTPLFSLHDRDGDRFHCLQASPSSPYQLVASTTSSLLLLDERFDGTPLQEWYQHVPMRFLQVVPLHHIDGIIACGGTPEEVLFHEFGSPQRQSSSSVHPVFSHVPSCSLDAPRLLAFLMDTDDPIVGMTACATNQSSFVVHHVGLKGHVTELSVTATPANDGVSRVVPAPVHLHDLQAPSRCVRIPREETLRRHAIVNGSRLFRHMLNSTLWPFEEAEESETIQSLSQPQVDALADFCSLPRSLFEIASFLREQFPSTVALPSSPDGLRSFVENSLRSASKELHEEDTHVPDSLIHEQDQAIFQRLYSCREAKLPEGEGSATPNSCLAFVNTLRAKWENHDVSSAEEDSSTPVSSRKTTREETESLSTDRPRKKAK